MRTPELRQATEEKAAEALRELGLDAPAGQAAFTFSKWDGFEMTVEDEAEWKRPLHERGVLSCHAGWRDPLGSH